MRKSDVFSCWKESLTLLNWAEFKLILLVSLNNFRRTTIILFKKFWWLLVLWFLFSYGANLALLDASSFWNPLIFSFLAGLLNICLLYVSFLTTRASLEPKNYSYYVTYFSKILFFLLTVFGCVLFSFLFFIAGPTILLNLGKLFFNITIIPTPVMLNQFKDIVTELLISPAIILSGFFILDGTSHDVISSIKRGFLFFVYFLPLVVIIQCLALIFFLLAIVIMNHQINTGPCILTLIRTLCALYTNFIFLFSLAIFSILYTKLKHTHHHLFFE